MSLTEISKCALIMFFALGTLGSLGTGSGDLVAITVFCDVLQFSCVALAS